MEEIARAETRHTLRGNLWRQREDAGAAENDDVPALHNAGGFDPRPFGHRKATDAIGEIPFDITCIDYPRIDFVDDIALFTCMPHTMRRGLDREHRPAPFHPQH